MRKLIGYPRRLSLAAKLSLAVLLASCSAQQRRATVAELAPVICRNELQRRGVAQPDVDAICSNAPALAQLGEDIATAVQRARLRSASGGAPGVSGGLGGEGGEGGGP